MIAVAAVAFSRPSNGTGGGGGDQTSSVWQPTQGHYLDYMLKINGSTYGTERFLVVSAGSTILLNITTDANGTVTQQDQVVNLGQAVGPSFDLENPPWDRTVTNEGKVSVMTPFGSRTCDHYFVSVLNQNQAHINVTMDLYLYKTLMVKMEADDGISTFSMLLTGTNIPVIVDG